MFGLFSIENGCFVRLVDLSSSPVDPALKYACLGFCEREGAEAAKETVQRIARLKELEVRKLA
jgi:hypothetical protein